MEMYDGYTQYIVLLTLRWRLGRKAYLAKRSKRRRKVLLLVLVSLAITFGLAAYFRDAGLWII